MNKYVKKLTEGIDKPTLFVYSLLRFFVIVVLIIQLIHGNWQNAFCGFDSNRALFDGRGLLLTEGASTLNGVFQRGSTPESGETRRPPRFESRSSTK